MVALASVAIYFALIGCRQCGESRSFSPQHVYFQHRSLPTAVRFDCTSTDFACSLRCDVSWVYHVVVIIISRVLQSMQIPAIRLRHHPLRGVDSVCLQILLMGTCRQCGSWSVADHNHRKAIGREPLVQVITTWALTCPETVRQRPCMTREIETRLSDSRVGDSCEL